MSSPSAISVRWNAVLKLQRVEADSHPGSQTADDAEHATTLALSDARSATNATYLAYDARRDARRIRNRRRPVVALSALGAAASSGYRPAEYADHVIDVATDHIGRHADPPDRIAEARDLEAALRQHLANTPGAVICLEDLLTGEPEATTARRLGVPRHRVSALRTFIRGKLRALIAGPPVEVVA